MIDFWLAAAVLLCAALAFLLLPLVLLRRATKEDDRTAVNVSLYDERLSALTEQRDAGTLGEEQYDAGVVEAGRELLGDTAGTSPASAIRRPGGWLVLGVAMLVPLLGLGLYLHWGDSDKLALAYELSAPPRSLEEMTQRLERVVKAQPDSAEAWYYLGRAYMAQERGDEAVKSFARATNLAGRRPELLGQWAQALYFAAGKHWSGDIQALVSEALRGDPQEGTSLGLLGIHAFEERRFAEAVGYWQRLLATLPESDPSRAAIESGIQRAREQLDGAAEPAKAPTVALRVRVTLADALKDKVRPGDSVFVFARAVSGPPMPLAVKRLTVADLPATVTLDDADAMMPQLRLSAFSQVRLAARVSRAGDATAGEWVAQGEPLQTDSAAEQTLVIDHPDPH